MKFDFTRYIEIRESFAQWGIDTALTMKPSLLIQA
jgi:hypothetical protein